MTLRQSLDRLYREFDFRARIDSDPIKFPKKYKEKKDIEVSGLIASAFAYGRVELFLPVIEKILSAMGKNPHEFLINYNEKRDSKIFAGISYRFQKENDIKRLISILSDVLRRYGTIENLFYFFYSPEDRNIKNALEGMQKELKLIRLFPLPSTGSACKRANLFLRWMIRDKDIDFGIWRGIGKSKLIIPLDTHIARVSNCLGLTKRKTPSWAMAEEITDSLKRFDPDDPLRYDFSLCHSGIMGLCNKMRCSDCKLNSQRKNL